MYHIAVTIIALGLLLTVWVLFQNWIRRHTPGMRDDADVLRGRFGSCGACFDFEDCRLPELIADTDVLKVDSVDEIAL